MKKILSIAAVSLVAMASCTSQTAGYQINGTVTDSTMNGKTVYLVNVNAEEKTPFDSAVVANNTFTFTKAEALTSPEVLSVKLGRAGINILVDNGSTVQVTLNNPQVDLSTCSDNGGLNDKYMTLQNIVSEKAMKMRETYGNMMQAGVSRDSIQNTIMAMQTEIKSLYTNCMQENKDNMLGGLIAAMIASEYNNLEELDAAMQQIKYADKYPQIQEHRKMLESKAATQEGKMFTDFDGKNIDGTPAKLSDHVGKGKYVLADFWASWCGPCRGEIPNLKELQTKFGGDKFTVLGINVWDKEDEFKKALESEGINYPQLYASDNNEATTLYGINGIPQIILFAPDGTIVKRDLRGAGMIKFVTEELQK